MSRPKFDIRKLGGVLMLLLVSGSVALIGLRLLTPTHAAPAAYPNLNAKLVPTIPGALLGSTSNDTGSSNLFGRKLDIIHFYYRWSNNFPLSGDQVYTATQAGQIPLVSWNPVGISWTAITAGSYNAYIDQIAHNFVAYNNTFHKPVFLVFNHEADARIRKGQGTAAQFQAAWRYIHDRFAADGATNVVWTMVLTAAPFSSPNNPTYGVNVMYPGDAYVDWVADDPYNWWDCPAHQSAYKTMYQLFSPLSAWDQTSNPAIGHTNTNLPLMIAETGSEENLGSGGAGLSKAGWFTAGITQIQSLPRIKAVVYFDHAQSTSVICNWIINSSAASQAAAHQLAINPYFNVMTQAPAPVDQPPTVSITSPGGGSTVSGSSVSITAVAADTGGTVARVAFAYKNAANTVWIPLSTDTTAPYAASWTIGGLPAGSYNVSATATDNAGLTAVSTITIEVAAQPAGGDTTAPTVPANISSPSRTTTSISLSWNASADPDNPASQLVYRVARNGASIGTTAPGVTSYTDSGLSPGTTYSYTLIAVDPAGNASSASAAYTVSTNGLGCAAPAAPPGLSVRPLGPTSVGLVWQPVAAPSANCPIANYVVQRAGVSIASVAATSYTDSGLTPSTAYQYQVLAVTIDHTAGAVSAATVTTPPAPDTTPPTTPTGLSAAAATSTQVNLTWGPSADPQSGIKLYQVLRNGQMVGTTTTTSYGDSGLSPNTSYSYQVVAVNGVGLLSAAAQAVVTTPDVCAVATVNPGCQSGNPIPILQGTTSVGGGTDSGSTGAQPSVNPTFPTAGTDNPGIVSPAGQSLTAAGNASPQTVAASRAVTQARNYRQIAVVGSAAGTMLGLLGVVSAFLLWRRGLQRSYIQDSQADMQPAAAPSLYFPTTTGRPPDDDPDKFDGGAP